MIEKVIGSRGAIFSWLSVKRYQAESRCHFLFSLSAISNAHQVKQELLLESQIVGVTDCQGNGSHKSDTIHKIYNKLQFVLKKS